MPYSPECVEGVFSEVRRVEGFSRKLASPEKFIADSSALAIVMVGWVSTFSEQFLLLSRVARWFPHGPPFALTLLHPSDPWPLAGHPEAMKMSCRRAYFHASDAPIVKLRRSRGGCCSLYGLIGG